MQITASGGFSDNMDNLSFVFCTSWWTGHNWPIPLKEQATLHVHEKTLVLPKVYAIEPNEDSHRKQDRSLEPESLHRHFLNTTPLWHNPTRLSCRRLVRVTLVGYFCKTLLRDTLAGHLCATFVCNAPCKTILWDVLVVHFCNTILWDTPSNTLLWKGRHASTKPLQVLCLPHVGATLSTHCDREFFCNLGILCQIHND